MFGPLMVQMTFTLIREKTYMVSGEELKTKRLADNKPPHSNRRLPATVWIGVGVTIIALVAASLKYSPHANAKPAGTTPASLPHVVVSRPLVENLDTRLSFLGQFSAVSQVEIRAQLGGTLTGISFKDGDIVQKGDLLFTIDPQPVHGRVVRNECGTRMGEAILTGQNLVPLLSQ